MRDIPQPLSGCFSRQLSSSLRTFRGTPARSGSCFNAAARISPTSSPRKSGRPVSISYSRQPKDQMSVRASSSLPEACSGDM
jgi:hypothetical protein